MIDTNEILLDQVRRTDAHEAWKLLYENYWAVILGYARRLGLPEHQAEEVLQETMVTLMRVLPGFAYDRTRGKFRNYLLTIVHRRSLAAMRRARRERESTVPWEDERAPEPAAADGVDQEAEARWRDSVLDEALRRLWQRPDLEERACAIFEAYVVRRRPAAEVAREFGVKENAVYQIKNRLLRFLRLEAERLTRGLGEEP